MFSIRPATADDIPAMLAIINDAFAIETFLEGPRADEGKLAHLLETGTFLLASDSSGQLTASVYVEVRGERGYFGMLSVDPAHQRQGLGRALVASAENFCRNRGCKFMDISVLSQRPELPPFYRGFGYAETGIEDFVPGRPMKAGLECHLIIMSKAL